MSESAPEGAEMEKQGKSQEDFRWIVDQFFHATASVAGTHFRRSGLPMNELALKLLCTAVREQVELGLATFREEGRILKNVGLGGWLNAAAASICDEAGRRAAESVLAAVRRPEDRPN